MDAKKYAKLLKIQINQQKALKYRKHGGGTREMLKDLRMQNTFGTGVPYDKINWLIIINILMSKLFDDEDE